ncbi:MAG TPA: ABC transporter substrate-binding protein, partial [Pseudonocardia sp.]|nr:ABC transporter substrate-binding protein [Pseudonocardia sp.]
MRSAVRRLSAACVAGALAITLAACAESERDPGQDGAAGGSGGTMVFGAPGAPDNFDPLFAQDGETFRPARQMYDTLITHELGTSNLAPALATDWSSNPEGTEWTFTLREGVTFHDGTPFNGEAVCFNFERWNNFTGVLQSDSLAYYWAKVNGGFATSDVPTLNGTGKYESCEAPDEATAVIHL